MALGVDQDDGGEERWRKEGQTGGGMKKRSEK